MMCRIGSWYNGVVTGQDRETEQEVIMKTIKTKIVATIGAAGRRKNKQQGSSTRKSSYSQGIYDMEGSKIAAPDIGYEYLVKEFCSHGVDLIRLNLSHVRKEDIAEVFSEIKEAILAWEEENTGRRVALLADLPGPKIRFHFDREMHFKIGAEFTVHFDRQAAGDSEAAVYIDDKRICKHFSPTSGLILQIYYVYQSLEFGRQTDARYHYTRVPLLWWADRIFR